MLNDFVPNCDTPNIGGVEMEIMYSCAKEHKIEPRSKNKMPSPTNAAGHSNEIGENYDFSDAPTGEGYWKKMTIISETGEIMTDGTVTDGTTNLLIP